MENKKKKVNHITILYILCVLNIIVSIATMGYAAHVFCDHAQETTNTIQTDPSIEETSELVDIEDATTEPTETLVEIEDVTTEPITEETTVETTEPPKATEPSKEPSKEPTKTTEPSTEPDHSTDNDILELLACVIYQETGGDHHCDMCRRRVADVVLNRVADERFPNTVYGVLTQKNQYGNYYSTGVVWPSRASKPEEKHAVERAYRIAQEVLNGQHSELYGKGYIWQSSFIQGKDNVYCCGHYFGR